MGFPPEDRIREYTYYPGVDQPHSVVYWSKNVLGAPISSIYYYVTDQQNSVVGLIDAAGNLVNRYESTSGASRPARPRPFRSRCATVRGSTTRRPACRTTGRAGTTPRCDASSARTRSGWRGHRPVRVRGERSSTVWGSKRAPGRAWKLPPGLAVEGRMRCGARRRDRDGPTARIDILGLFAFTGAVPCVGTAHEPDCESAGRGGNPGRKAPEFNWQSIKDNWACVKERTRANHETTVSVLNTKAGDWEESLPRRRRVSLCAIIGSAGMAHVGSKRSQPRVASAAVCHHDRTACRHARHGCWSCRIGGNAALVAYVGVKVAWSVGLWIGSAASAGMECGRDPF